MKFRIKKKTNENEDTQDFNKCFCKREETNIAIELQLFVTFSLYEVHIPAHQITFMKNKKILFVCKKNNTYKKIRAIENLIEKIVLLELVYELEINKYEDQ